MKHGTDKNMSDKSSELVPSYASELGTRISVVAEVVGDRKSAARVAGISSDSLQRYIRGEVQAPFHALVKLCEAANCSLEWLANGIGTMRKPDGITEHPNGYHVSFKHNESSPDSDAYCYVPLYDVYASAGHGSLIDNEQIVDRLAFKQDWLKGEMGLTPENCCLIHVTGDSMEPTLHKKDVVMLDRTHTIYMEDGIYCLHLDGGLLVKRLQRINVHQLEVISDNPVYRSYSLNTSDIQIIGRIVWAGKRF